MDVCSDMLTQAIPFVMVLVLYFFGIVLHRVNKFHRILFYYILLGLFCSVLIYSEPRTGDPYVNIEAMLFLGVCFCILLCPMLAVYEPAKNAYFICTKRDDIFCLISYALIAITIPATLYFFKDGVQSFWAFNDSGLTRDEYREVIDISSRDKGVLVIGLFFAMLFSKCALFMALYGFFFLRNHWALNSALAVGSLALLLKNLKRISRSDMVTFLLFAASVMCVFYQYADMGTRRRIRRLIVILSLAVGGLFITTSILRFGSEFCTSLYTYFATGPYSFNADYAVVTEYDWSSNGDLCVPMLKEGLSRLCGNEYHNIMPDFYYDDIDIQSCYDLVSGGYRCEFKTFAGSLLFDFGRLKTIIILLLYAIIVWNQMQRAERSLCHSLWSSIYYYIVMMSLFGYPFTTSQLNMELIVLAFFSVVLQLFPFAEIILVKEGRRK